MEWSIESSIIFETLTGSHVYGTATSLSDKDYRGVCIPPHYIREGLIGNFEQKDSWGGLYEDRVIYNLNKFMLLAKEGNPAIVELLFIPLKFWKTGNSQWVKIIENRHLFLSKKVRFTFSGYAHSQLGRIKRHRGWLLNPPKIEPTREGYGLAPNPILSQAQLSALLTLPEDVVIEGYREEARKEKAYKEAKIHWDMYAEWKKSRNPERAKLEEKFGYDTKHAMHLVRLMKEAEEVMTTGNITFPRPEVSELIAIRNGEYIYDELMEMVDKFDEKFEELYEKSPLPHSPDFKGINKLYLSLIEEIMGWAL